MGQQFASSAVFLGLKHHPVDLLKPEGQQADEGGLGCARLRLLFLCLLSPFLVLEVYTLQKSKSVSER